MWFALPLYSFAVCVGAKLSIGTTIVIHLYCKKLKIYILVAIGIVLNSI